MQKETILTFTKKEVIDMLHEALKAKGINPIHALHVDVGEDPTWDGPNTNPVLKGMTVTIKESI